MSTVNAVFVDNLGLEFDVTGTNPDEASKIKIKIDGSLVRDVTTGEIGLSGASLTVVSADAGNIVIAGSDGKAYLDQSGIQAVESVWSGSEASGFLTVTPGGTNGHAVTYGFDWNNADFREACQDAVGAAAIAGSGLSYDDLANSISTTLGNITFGNGLNYDTGANIVTVQPDPASPSAVSVGAAGVSVTPGISADANNLAKLGTDNRVLVDSADVTALATVDVCDAFGVSMFRALPA